MKSRLNFKHMLVVIILPFVSLSTVAGTGTPTSGQDKVEQLKTEIKKDPKNTKLVVQLAQEFYNQKDYEKVTLLLWKQIDKIDRPAILLLARAHEARNETGDMIRALNNLIGKNDKDFEAYSLLGNAYVLQKKPKEALESYKSAIEANPKYEPPYNALMKMYETRQPPNYYEMRILAQDMIDNIGKRPEYLEKLCEVNTNDGTFEAGVTTCREVIQKDPKRASAYVNLGLSMKGMGDDDKAKATLKKAADDFPKSEFAQYTYGNLLEEDKSSIEAMRYFKTGTEADPKSARSWLGLATSSFDNKKYDVSLIAYKNACKFDKKNAVAFRKATTILRNSRVTEWVGKFESASENCTF
ncbi:tetratricopeptide repeat protein [Bdellovibrio sp. SKB1291214]|uniref:tetratricopeptide repeat protein n=1 Tax=Bdellovibrio sp. SKB1291214 TaxID=1732569 RepID=UPI000B51AB55|nr:tetratricopeptide repeat protein [Bdellovibrio sp. SKB1291214]UYL10617.1 tetratricopeptide repeat protein [Bdellovibrio sp. SKB1291214]